MPETMNQRIARIPGPPDYWWSSSAQETYEKTARELVQFHGLSEEAAVGVLYRLYHAAAECFGE